MEKISLDTSKIQVDLNEKLSKVKEALEKIENKTGPGNEFLGWVSLPENYDKEEFDRIKKAAQRIRANSEALVVIGIGGSYLGARAVIEALKPNFYNESEKLKIYFCGQNVSGQYLNDLLKLIEQKDISVNVISKSGTTLEPAVAFRALKKLMEEKYGDSANERIFVTTDKEKGALKGLASKEGYETFIVPDDIGGRYSVLSAVGLLPIAASGIDIDELLRGARDGMIEYSKPDIDQNPALQYAAIRNILYEKGKKVELMVNYEPSMSYFAEWWKQLFGESEGKNGKGLFPASVLFTTDLHSLGQYIQEGERILFETVIDIQKKSKDAEIENASEDLDGLNYLSGKTANFVNEKALLATIDAHEAGGVPNARFVIPEMTAYYLGKLIYLFEMACAISAYTLGVNPFDQPGVEEYKKRMFQLLGRN